MKSQENGLHGMFHGIKNQMKIGMLMIFLYPLETIINGTQTGSVNVLKNGENI